MARLVLLVHAETAATRAAVFPADEPITERGRAAAERLAPGFPPFDTVSRSPALAAAETAAILQLSAAVDDALADLDWGRWRGRSIAALAEAEPEAVAAWRREPGYTGHGGGSLDDFLAAMTTWLEAAKLRGGSHLALTHASFVRCAVLAALAAPAHGFWRIEAGPLTSVELTSDGRRWSLRRISPAG